MNDANAVAACQRLIAAFAHHVDHRESEELVQLFAEDGTFERRGEILRGHAEIRASQAKRPTGVVVRHVCAHPYIELVDAEHARGVTYFQIFRAHGSADEVLPLPPAEVLGQFEDEFVLTASGWRIQARCARGIFRNAA
jgi:hypothetical protein